MREPFSILSLVKSPMGLMIGFMVIVMFLMPKLVGKFNMSVSSYASCFHWHFQLIEFAHPVHILPIAS